MVHIGFSEDKSHIFLPCRCSSPQDIVCVSFRQCLRFTCVHVGRGCEDMRPYWDSKRFTSVSQTRFQTFTHSATTPPHLTPTNHNVYKGSGNTTVPLCHYIFINLQKPKKKKKFPSRKYFFPSRLRDWGG